MAQLQRGTSEHSLKKKGRKGKVVQGQMGTLRGKQSLTKGDTGAKRLSNKGQLDTTARRHKGKDARVKEHND